MKISVHLISLVVILEIQIKTKITIKLLIMIFTHAIAAHTIYPSFECDIMFGILESPASIINDYGNKSLNLKIIITIKYYQNYIRDYKGKQTEYHRNGS